MKRAIKKLYRQLGIPSDRYAGNFNLQVQFCCTLSARLGYAAIPEVVIPLLWKLRKSGRLPRVRSTK